MQRQNTLRNIGKATPHLKAARRWKLWSALAFHVLLWQMPAHAATCSAGTENAYPSGAVVNVWDFGAKGDGVTDDTAAILRAIDPAQTLTGPYTSAGIINPLTAPVFYNKPVYFPAGTYLVSNTLEKRIKDKISGYLGLANGRYFSGLILLGACQDQTIIKLKDNAPGFANPSTPKAVIFAASSLIMRMSSVIDASGNLLAGKTPADVVATSTLGGKDYINKGEGNDAYMNFIENITVDVGAGNPGAIGIDFVGSNVAAIRNVAVRDLYGTALTGISMKRFGPGPYYVKNVQIVGFDVGIDISQPEYAATLEHIRITNSRSAGLRNNQNSVAIRDLQATTSPGRAIVNLAAAGLVVVVEGTLQNATSSVLADAVQNNGYLNLRNVRISGYSSLCGAPAPSTADGIYYGNTFLQRSSPSWSIGAQDFPGTSLGALANGADVTSYGADSTGKTDSTAAIQNALNSGKATIYFPNGQYMITKSLIVPATVRRIEGLFSTIRKGAWINPVTAFFQVNNLNYPFEVSHLNFDNTNLGNNIALSVGGTNPFLVRDSFNSGISAVQFVAGGSGGQLFIENIATAGLSFTGPAQVWARQLNTEGGGTRITNTNADLWILGIKTEGNATVVGSSGANSRVEVLGGLIYSVNTANPIVPAFKNTDGRMSVSYGEEAFSAATAYTIHVQDVQNGIAINHNATDFPQRLFAGRQFYPRIVPQFMTVQ